MDSYSPLTVSVSRLKAGVLGLESLRKLDMFSFLFLFLAIFSGSITAEITNESNQNMQTASFNIITSFILFAKQCWT